MGHKPEITPKKAAAYRAHMAKPSADGGMSENAAIVEAQRRWGPLGVAWHPAYTKRGEYRWCAVGGMIGETREQWQVFGRGKSFEEAFVDATARGH